MRDWNARWEKLRCANLAPVTRYRSSTTSGNSSTGSVMNRKFLARERAAQTAQASLAVCWSSAGPAGCCGCAASGVRFLCGNGRGDRETCASQPDFTGRCGCRVKMPPRQRKLGRERKQRQPRAGLEVFSKPVHDDDAFVPPDGSGTHLPTLGYVITYRPRLECQ